MKFDKKGAYHLSNINKLGVVKLIATIGFAAITTIWAVYLESFLHNQSYVGFLESFFIIIAFLSYFFIIPIVQKYNKIKLYATALFLFVVAYVIFSFVHSLWIIILIGICTAFLGSLRITCFGIIVRDKSPDKKVSENEGLIYTLLNISVMIGPLLAGFVASRYGVSKVFLLSAILIFIAFILFEHFRIHDGNTSKKVDKNIAKVFIDFFKNRQRLFSYIIGGGINFWWGLIYIYMPMFIIDSGYSDILLGYFLAAVVVPLILSEYYFGRLAGKIGFRKIFFFGYLILAICALACFFVSNMYLLLGLLTLASFGAAMVEPTTEAYFFDIIKKTERERYYGPYNTAVDTGLFIATSLSALILLFASFNYLFVFFGLAMFALALLSLKIKDVVECRQK